MNTLGKGKDGSDVYLSDIWPDNEEINEAIDKFVQPDLFKNEYKKLYMMIIHYGMLLNQMIINCMILI